MSAQRGDVRILKDGNRWKVYHYTDPWIGDPWWEEDTPIGYRSKQRAERKAARDAAKREKRRVKRHKAIAREQIARSEARRRVEGCEG